LELWKRRTAKAAAAGTKRSVVKSLSDESPAATLGGLDNGDSGCAAAAPSPVLAVLVEGISLLVAILNDNRSRHRILNGFLLAEIVFLSGDGYASFSMKNELIKLIGESVLLGGFRFDRPGRNPEIIGLTTNGAFGPFVLICTAGDSMLAMTKLAANRPEFSREFRWSADAPQVQAGVCDADRQKLRRLALDTPQNWRCSFTF
jgi:hypothetical protein